MTQQNYLLSVSPTHKRGGTMNTISKYGSVIIVAGFMMLLAGCSANPQIVRIPFISPVIIPSLQAPQPFLMNIAVQNYSTTQTSTDLWLKIYTEYYSSVEHPKDQPPCSYTDWVHVGVLAPGKGWGQADYRMDRNNQSCPCVINNCPGHTWLDLHVAQGYEPHINGENTALHVNWVPSGDLAQETISAF
jgi:hypothetical protein